MRTLPLAAACAVLAAFAAPVAAQRVSAPKCPPPGAGGQTPNWGNDFDLYMQETFNAVKLKSGVDQPVRLIAANQSRGNANARMIEGTPLGAVPKGTIDGVDTDAVFYTYGIFELSCSQAQLAFFSLHEMRHLKKDADGKNHFTRVNECTNRLYDAWKSGTDLSAFPTPQARQAEFTRVKHNEVATQCVLPVEKEADAYAFAMVPTLGAPWNEGLLADVNSDPRVQAFKNEELWLGVLGLGQSDPGHGSAAERQQQMAQLFEAEAKERQKRAEAAALQTLPGPH